MSALDEEKTFTQLGFMPLTEPDISIRSVKKQTLYTTNSFKEWNYKFWEWKHGYRRRYSEEFLRNRGYETDAQGQAYKFDDAEYELYAETICTDYKATLDKKINVIGPDYQMRWFLQNNSGSWSNRDNLLDGKWVLERVSFAMFSDPFGNADDKADEDTIIGYFHNKDDESDKMELDIHNEYGHDDVMQIKYIRKSEPADEWFLEIVRVEDVPEEILIVSGVRLTPMIPLKEDGVQVKETSNLKKMMRKLNVDADAFQETLDEKDDDGEPAIDNAYLMNGLPLRNPYEVEAKYYSAEDAEALPYKLLHKIRLDQDSDEGYNVTQEISDWFYDKHMREQAYLARGLFKTFANYSGEVPTEATEKKVQSARYIDYVEDFGTVDKPREHNLLFKTSHVSMRYAYSISVTTHEGRVREDVTDGKAQATFHFSGTIYSPQDNEDEDQERTESVTPDSKGYDELLIRVQVDEDHYQEMIITNYLCTYKISGQVLTATLGYPIRDHKIIIPYFVLYNNKFTEYVTVYEHSLMFMAYSIKVVVVKFWKKVIGVFIGALFCLFSGGAGCSLVTFIIQTVISYAVGYLIGKILELIDSELLKLLFQIGVMLFQMYMGGVDFTALTSEVYLKIAVQVGKLAINAYEAQMMKQLADEKKEQEAEDRITERIEGVLASTHLVPAMSLQAHTGLNTAGPDAYYADALGQGLMNYDQYYNIDGEIELRKQVTAG